MRIEYLIILIIALLMIIIIYYIEPILSKQKLNNKSEHGSSRWAKVSEIKRNYQKEYIKSINDVGLPIYFSKNLKKVWFDKETPHWCFLGSSGSGKSSTSVIPQCIFIANSKRPKSVFITDPKGEIFSKTSKMFKDKGFNILTIDFRNPDLSNRINILEPCILDYDRYINCKQKINDINKELTSIESRYKLIKKDYEYLLNMDNLKLYRQKQKFFNYNNFIKINSKKIKQMEDIKLDLLDKRLQLNNKASFYLAESHRIANSTSIMITSDKTTQDPFWNNSAKDLLEGLINFFLEEYEQNKIKREAITLTEIKKFQNSTMIDENSDIFLEYIKRKPYGSKSKDKLLSILSSSENTYKSIVSVFNEKMSLFDDINVENITAESDFDFDILGKVKTVLYFIVPDEEKVYYKLISLIIALIYKELVKLANTTENKKLGIDVVFMLDEIANCPPINDIETIISVSRSRGMSFNFYIQSFSQLNNVYGKEVAQVILDNCGLVYLKTNTEETAEAVSKRLGISTIETNSINYSISFVNQNGSKSTNLIGRPLLTADEIKQLHYKMIIFPVKGHPYIRDTILYTKFNNYIDGTIDREYRGINLKEQYFTVESLFKNASISNEEKIQSENNNTKDYQRKLLNELFNNIKNELSNIQCLIDYKTVEDNVILFLNFINPLSGNKMMNILNKVDFDKYEYQITASDDINSKFATIIEFKLIKGVERCI